MSLDIDLIRSSFENVKPIAQDVADHFYETLFADFPEAKALFKKVKLERQKQALLQSLVFIVEHLDQADTLTDYLRKMGARHVTYGTKEEHYPMVGQSLIKTFQFFFKDAWTQELEANWISAFEFIAGAMLEGASSVKPELADIRKKARTVCNELLYEILNDEIDENFITEARDRIRQVLLKVLDEETEKLFDKAA